MATPIGPALTGPVPSPANLTRTMSDIGAQWSDWLSKPENKAALVQTGIQLLQPIAPGQSVGGAIGTAIGSGASARDRAITSQQARATAQRDAALTAAQTEAAQGSAEQARANAEALRSGTKGSQTLAATMARLDDAARARWLKFYTGQVSAAQFDSSVNTDPAALFAQWQAAETAYANANPVAAPPSTLRAALPNDATTLPSAAVANLKEGVVTLFGNGQRWTLKAGQPVRIQ